MPRYIEATDAIRVLSEYYNPMTDAERYAIALVISEVPTADVQEVKCGKWIRNDNGTYSCSVCHSWITGEQYYYARHCLHCGAKMKWIVSREDPSHPFADSVMMGERSEDG